MACFIVPLTQALVTTAVRKHVSRNQSPVVHNPFAQRLNVLEAMLYGGSAMLIVDHIASGELTAVYPFFTAGISTIWHEILTVGVPMSLITTCLWAVVVAVRAHKTPKWYIKSPL